MIVKLRHYRVIAAGLIFLTVPLFAQQEQWLGYKTAQYTYSYIGSTYGQRLTLTDKTPEGLKLPKLKDETPLFAKWDTPMVKQPVWFILARSHKNGAYDRLYINSNLDGSFSDEKPVKSYDSTNSGRSLSARFQFVDISLPGEDGPVAYSLSAYFDKHDKNANLYLDPACWYEGWVTLDGKKLWCVLIDNNANGKFNDVSAAKNQCDRIRISESQKFIPREKTDTTRFLGKYVSVEGKLYCVEISPDGAYVKFKPAGEVPIGTVQCGKLVNSINIMGSNGNFVETPIDGKARVPAGEYNLDAFEIERKDESGANWKLSGRYQKKTLTVQPDKTVSLGIAEPFICQITAVKQDKQYRIFLQMKTADDGSFTLTNNGNRPPAPKIQIKNADGSYDKSFRLEYG